MSTFVGNIRLTHQFSELRNQHFVAENRAVNLTHLFWFCKKTVTLMRGYISIFTGAAFKTQKEVVKAIFVNNIEKLGHHYARVFDESW